VALTRYAILICAFFVAIPVCSEVISSEPRTIPLSRTFTIRPLDAGRFQWEVDLDLGRIPVNSQIELDLKLINETGKTLQLSGFSASCNCVVVEEQVQELKANSNGNLKLKIKPISNRTSSGTASFVIFNPAMQLDRLQVKCTYAMEGILAFSQPMYRFELRGKGKTELEPVRLPILFTKPINLDELTIDGSGDFKDSDLKIENSGDQAFAVIEVSPRSLEGKGLFGSLLLRHAATGANADCRVTLVSVGDSTFSPHKVVLTWDDKSKSFVGSGIFRLFVNPRKGLVTPESPLKIATSANTKIRLNLSAEPIDPLGMIQRIIFSSAPLSPEANATHIGNSVVNLVFQCDQKKFSHSCEVVFLK
jgi:hypothetical protein